MAAVALFAATVSGQQPKRKALLWAAPLLPAEPAWAITLPARPTAGGAMDVERVYVPVAAPEVSPDDIPVLVARTLQAPATAPDLDGGLGVRPPAVVVPAMPLVPAAAVLLALNRETGAREWGARLETAWPPLVGGGAVFVAVGNEIWALDPPTGRRLWSLKLDARPRAPLRLGGNVLLVLTAPGELVGIRVDTQEIAWRRVIAEPDEVRISADDRAAYVATNTGRLSRVALVDGTVTWQVMLEGQLSLPTVTPDRVFVGSTANSLWAIKTDSGKIDWAWLNRFGGDVIGAAIDRDVVYVAMFDNILRAFNVGNGNQKWKQAIGTRPVLPPLAFGGVVVIAGLTPNLQTFDGRAGTKISTWSVDTNAEQLQGPPLVDPVLRPYRTSIVAILRNGRVTALRPTAMMFKEPAAGGMTELPGRLRSIERRPGLPQPVPLSR